MKPLGLVRITVVAEIERLLYSCGILHSLWKDEVITMTTQFSKKRSDGTVEHYESREEMEAADLQSIVSTLTFISFFVGGIIAHFALKSFGLSDIPTWIKFTAVSVASIASSLIVWKFGKILVAAFYLLFSVLILCVVGSIIWQLVNT